MFQEIPATRMEQLKQIVKLLENRQIFNIDHYNQIIDVYMQNEHNINVSTFLADLAEKGIKPNK